jgi:hypothetical protein
MPARPGPRLRSERHVTACGSAVGREARSIPSRARTADRSTPRSRAGHRRGIRSSAAMSHRAIARREDRGPAPPSDRDLGHGHARELDRPRGAGEWTTAVPRRTLVVADEGVRREILPTTGSWVVGGTRRGRGGQPVAPANRPTVTSPDGPILSLGTQHDAHAERGPELPRCR